MPAALLSFVVSLLLTVAARWPVPASPAPPAVPAAPAPTAPAPAAPSGAAATPPCLRPPVAAPVVDPFRPPACPWCAGNRGIELAPPAGTGVAAAADGVVSFAGEVAGVLYVVVEHGGGFRTTYGRLASVDVRVGQTVRLGTGLGRSTERLFFGLRHGDEYLDPAPWFGHLEVRPHLVPTDGRNRRPAPPARLACPARPVAARAVDRGAPDG